MLKKILIGCLSALLLLSGCSVKTNTASTISETTNFKMTVLNAGKGDAIVLESDNEVMVVDTGYDDTYDVLKEYLETQGITTINYLVITHYDKDHVGGAESLVEDYKIENVYTPSYEGTSKKYQKFIEALSSKGMTYTNVTSSTSITMDDVKIDILSTSLSYDGEDGSDNDMSLVVSINHGDNSFLLAGDAEKPRLKELMSQLKQTYDVYKVPHHGRIEDNSESFISLISPKYAIITCSAEEPADDELLDILAAHNVDVYTSATNGTITVYSDGSTIKITGES